MHQKPIMTIYKHALTGVSTPACMGLLGMVQAHLSGDASLIMYVRSDIKKLTFF